MIRTVLLLTLSTIVFADDLEDLGYRSLSATKMCMELEGNWDGVNISNRNMVEEVTSQNIRITFVKANETKRKVELFAAIQLENFDGTWESSMNYVITCNKKSDEVKIEANTSDLQRDGFVSGVWKTTARTVNNVLSIPAELWGRVVKDENKILGTSVFDNQRAPLPLLGGIRTTITLKNDALDFKSVFYLLGNSKHAAFGGDVFDANLVRN